MPPSALATSAFDVTAVIPTYNRADRIEAAVRSVQAQEPPPERIIVVDDGSSDGTADVVRSLDVELLEQERNLGVCAARNAGLAAARTTWVAWLDSDDVWVPGHLAGLASIAGDHVFVANSSVGVFPEGRRWVGPPSAEPMLLDSPPQLLFPENFVATSSMAARREVLEEIGGYRQEKLQIEDLDLMVRLLERGTALISPKVGSIYDEHGGDQMSADLVRMRGLHRDLIASYADRPWWSPKLLRSFEAACEWDDARLAQRQGRIGDMARGLARLASDPRKALAVAAVIRLRRKGRRLLQAAPPVSGA